ncbi:unnamed protein product (macronuclear) [Paramecium tetraurelia]|uniref:Uncharacterized protein n=1 Tax=Paramecium tetraurelia TaxID=5888 RepID=A0ECK8_PARTE|nr:uncharacterized protein GSPATT00003894001 [Paramecium tetraurelia]CAK93025.1 unnamed protein product [Paramecium tetraurelia]|eukprot:XP_001460422.1 hypothetical protein (macronuclear) [Paramecium tetraurelia strain d4-2]
MQYVIRLMNNKILANSIGSMQEIEYLENRVYPKLHTALVQLIDHVVKTEEVRKHQERLKKIKIFDRIEQKKVEKQRLKNELGSAYESSSQGSAENDDFGGMSQQLIKNEDSIFPINNQIQAPTGISIDDLSPQEMKKEINLALNKIQEDLEDEEAPDKQELQHLKQQMKQQREALEFNPLIYLAHLLREQQK